MHFRTLDHSRLILNAADKYQALRKVSHIIYWRGSKPYGIPYIGSNHKIHLVRVKGSNIRRYDDYTIVSESINGFDYVTQYGLDGMMIQQNIVKSIDPIYDLGVGFDFNKLFD